MFELTLEAPTTTKNVVCFSHLQSCFEASLTNSVDPDQTAYFGAAWSGSTTFAICTQNTSTASGNHMQQTTLADHTFGCISVSGLRVKIWIFFYDTLLTRYKGLPLMSKGKTKTLHLKWWYILKDHGIFKMEGAIMLKALRAKSERHRKPWSGSPLQAKK